MRFENLTIVSVDGREGDLSGAQYALLQSAKQLPGARVLLLSPVRPKTLFAGVEHIRIAPLGYLEYSLFIVYALHKFISTEFALIVQNDGWVLDGAQWRPEFFEYDYVGAPIHFARLTKQGKSSYLRGFTWMKHWKDSDCKIDVVLNGGFSLRSRRFLQAPLRLSLPYKIPAITSISSGPHKMQWESESTMEDVHLCIDMREELEKAGMRYAPLPLAKFFAFEHLDPSLHTDMDLKNIMGHHSRMRQMKSLHPLEIQYKIPQARVGSFFGESRVVKLFAHHGYDIKFPL